MRLGCLSAVSAIVLAWSGAVWAQPLSGEEESPAAELQEGHLNLPTPTLGGKQLWTDELVFRQWRIQRHAYTGHCRLLDQDNHRRAWGTFEQCRHTLEQLKRELCLPPVTGKVVITLHGIIRTRASMAGLCEFLELYGDYTAVNVSYASTRSDLQSHALALAHVVRNLDPGVTEINFVAHSLGNLVIRRYLDDCQHQRHGVAGDPRMHRIVMLAPPNGGAHLAEIFQENMLRDLIWGRSARQLAEEWDQVRQELAVPQCQFGILAGSASLPPGGNRLLHGENDLVVSVEETKLPGAHDFAVLPVIHGLIMDDPLARRYILMFLKHGHFISEARRQPLPKESAAP